MSYSRIRIPGRARPCLLAVVVAAGVAGCGRWTPDEEHDRPVVTVSIVPQRCFVERIAGDTVQVNVMVGPGESPATYEPSPIQLVALAQSQAYFTIGVPYETAWMPRLTGANRKMRVVDTVARIERFPQAGGHTHHERGEHVLDPHVWLSPTLVRQQAEVICDALGDLFPEHAANFTSNLARFDRDLVDLDASIRHILEDCPGKVFMVLHPSWNYFARDYGLEMLPIEEGGLEPSAAEMTRLITRARVEGVRVILAQPEFNTGAAETIARAINGRVVHISPLDEDWFGNMRTTAQAIAEGLQE